MAASNCSNRRFSIASLAVIATTSISLSAPPISQAPIVQELANRASGRVSNDEVAYRGSGRLDSGYGWLAYRASGRFSQGLNLAYRGSERDIKTV